MKGKDFTEEFAFVCALYKDDVSSTPLKIYRNIGNSNISILLDDVFHVPSTLDTMTLHVHKERTDKLCLKQIATTL